MHFRTVFVSDIHLGTRQCKVGYLLDFIRSNSCDNFFMVGDIIDLHSLKHRWYWPKEHSTFIQKVLRLSRKGTLVIYIPGNHDAAIRSLTEVVSPLYFGNINIVNHYEYDSLTGKRMLVVHGDEYDGALRSFGWLYWAGSRAYELALDVNTIYNWFRWLLGFDYWSLSAHLRSKVKGVIEAIAAYDELVVRQCAVSGYDGVIHGHSHTPGIKNLQGRLVLNSGDCVENCTCLAETVDGHFRLISLSDNRVLAEL